VDSRLDAIVAWDNLEDEEIASEAGPTHHVINMHVPDPTKPAAKHQPRVPALGLASNDAGQSFYDNSADKKIGGWRHWRAAGQPVVELVFGNVTHNDFAQTGSTQPGSEHDLKLQRFQWYTRAWFDRWLLDESEALDRLFAPTVAGASADALISSTWQSAMYLPERGIDCEDVRKCAPLAALFPPRAGENDPSLLPTCVAQAGGSCRFTANNRPVQGYISSVSPGTAFEIRDSAGVTVAAGNQPGIAAVAYRPGTTYTVTVGSGAGAIVAGSGTL
jgi:hypothetical protein